MKKGLCWIRRDIRLHDHAALSHCMQENEMTYVVFIFDPAILEPLRTRAPSDRRVQFIVESLFELHQKLREHKGGLIIRYGNPVEEIPKLVAELAIDQLYFNRDYTTYAMDRDNVVTQKVQAMERSVFSYKDHVIFEPNEILTQSHSPYRVFTPYKRAWQQQLGAVMQLTYFSVELNRLAPFTEDLALASIEKLSEFSGFELDASLTLRGGSNAGLARLAAFSDIMAAYHEARDFPITEGTSKLSVYLRHGCISIREMMNLALANPCAGSEKWLSELIWREFYQMIFFHYPEVYRMPFQEKFRALRWPGSDELLVAFKAGQTGFPLIDAAMRCLNQTGWMHNRLRMVVASFLTKILLVDWKKGERYFSWKLLDYELPSNNGGWQWAAGIGCDAAPYFRIFNPTTQSETYDSEGDFIREFCPELRVLTAKQIHCPASAKSLPESFQLGRDYPYPIVDYREQRIKALGFYKSASLNYAS